MKDLREILFNYRSYTPIPVLIAILVFARASAASLVAGFCVACAGESLRLWAVKYAGGATRTTSGVGGSVLITQGPFAYVRNPLYLGNFILSTGLVLMAWAWMPWMLLLFWALFFFQYGLIVSLEEAYLREAFGEAYANYLKNVSRFLPRLSPFNKQPAETMPLTRALQVEKNTLTSFAGVSLLIFLRWFLWL